MNTSYNAGDLVTVGQVDLVFTVIRGNTDDNPMVQLGYIRTDGIQLSARYVHFGMLTLIQPYCTIDYSAAVAKQMEAFAAANSTVRCMG